MSLHANCLLILIGTEGLQAHAVMYAVVSENGSMLTEPGTDPAQGLQIASQAVNVAPTASLAAIRSALQADASATFNAKLDRTDGSSIQFAWLDDKGLL